MTFLEFCDRHFWPLFIFASVVLVVFIETFPGYIKAILLIWASKKGE